MSAATVTWDERDSSATSSAGRFLADDFLPLVLDISDAHVGQRRVESAILIHVNIRG